MAPADVSPPDKPPGDARGRGPRRPAGHADSQGAAAAADSWALPTRGRSSRRPAGGSDGGDDARGGWVVGPPGNRNEGGDVS